MKYFCSKCGKTTIYGFELPKFCSSCGQSFATVSKPTNQTNEFLKELKLKKLNEPYKEECPVEEETPKINFKNIKASFKVDVYKPQGETFGSLIERPAPPQGNFNSEQPSKTSEQILSEFQREAGTSRTE